MELNKQDRPFVAKIHDIQPGNDYVEWFSELKKRYQKAQIKSAVKVHSEKLLWNWQLGRDMVQRKAEERWGSGIVEQLSLDLQDAFPDEKGFGVSNLFYMKKWYCFYAQQSNNLEKLHQLGGELQITNKQFNTKLHQLGGEIHEHPEEGLPFPEIFAFVPWRHHVEIITKCKTIDEAIYYIYRTIEDDLSRDELIRCLKSNLYKKDGGAISNFSTQLPALQANIAQEITKENYNFGLSDY